ncbi:FecR family protein [Sphingomonas sp. FW199]|uniref:FecR family protein n=1 Tax=Sphingomonas sp. FW199 TaxID=3400217 RepID=UPI003CEA9369
MSQKDGIEGAADPVREQAIAWLARLRADPSADDMDRFEQWYASDPEYADAYDAVLDSWEDTALLADSSAHRAAPVFQRQAWIKAAQVAAAALLLLIVGNLVYANLKPANLGAGSQIASKIGEIRSMTLGDGSRLTLDTDSEVEVRFDSGERRLNLIRGRARFAVAHDRERPFVVHAGQREVIAHGTLFDVDLGNSAVVVTLLQGSVEVRHSAAVGAAKGGRLLKPGQQLATSAKAPDKLVEARVIDGNWPSGMLSFEDAPLADVVIAANRYGRHAIILRDPALGRLRFTGTFKSGDQNALARLIGRTFALDVSQDANRNYLLAPAK